MAKDANIVIVCKNPMSGDQRVVLNPAKRTVVFERCHQPRSGLGVGFEAERVCQFEEILAVHDFLNGNHRGTFLRLILFLGRAVHVTASSNDLGSIFISTAFGRSRVFSNWNGYAELRSRLHQICAEQPKRGHWSEDPRFGPVFVVIIFAIVSAAIWFLL